LPACWRDDRRQFQHRFGLRLDLLLGPAQALVLVALAQMFVSPAPRSISAPALSPA